MDKLLGYRVDTGDKRDRRGVDEVEEARETGKTAQRAGLDDRTRHSKGTWHFCDVDTPHVDAERRRENFRRFGEGAEQSARG